MSAPQDHPLVPEVGGRAAPWPTTKVGDALTLTNGRAFKPSEWSNSGTPIVRIQNLNNPEAPFNYYQGDLPARIALQDGDLLFAWSGTPGTSFGAHIWRGGKAWLNQHIFKVGFNADQFDKRFLQLAINQNLTEYIRVAHGGAGLAHITKGRFEASTLPVPPLPEQRRIVAEIEKQFTRLDAGVAALRRVQANLKRYRAAVLKAACEGRLVPTQAELCKVAAASRRSPARTQSRDGSATFETGEALLARVLTERRQNWRGRGKYKEPAAPDTANLPPLPTGWTWATLSQLAMHITDGTHKTPKYLPAGVPFLSAKDIAGFRLSFDDCKYIAEGEHLELSKRCNVRRGNVLITKSGTIGRIAVVETDAEFSLFESVANVPLLPSLAPKYVAYAAFVAISGAFGAANQKGVAVRHLHLENLRCVPIPLPPLAEMKRIVAEVERRLSLVDELESVVSANLQRATRLRQSVLQQAFTGRL